MPKATTPISPGTRQNRRHNPLSDDLLATAPTRNKSSKRKAKHDADAEDNYVDSRSSRKILQIGQELADEEEQEARAAAPNPAFSLDSRFQGPSDSEEEDLQDDADEWGDDDEAVEEMVSL